MTTSRELTERDRLMVTPAVYTTVTVSKEWKDPILPAKVKGMTLAAMHTIETLQTVLKTKSPKLQNTKVITMDMS
jgi:hypothetical protein